MWCKCGGYIISYWKRKKNSQGFNDSVKTDTVKNDLTEENNLNGSRIRENESGDDRFEKRIS